MSSFNGKILVIRGGAIGDFILTLPAITALRRQFPQAHLEVLGYPHIIQLAVAGGLVDRAQSIEARALAGFFARRGPLEENLVDYFSEFDLIVSYLYDPDEIFQTNVGLCTGAQFIVGPHRPDGNQSLHATKVFLQPLERLAIFDADHVPRLDLHQRKGQPATTGGQRSERESATDKNYLALHPGSGSDRKNWPEEKWAELLDEILRTRDLKVVLVGGEAEGERLQRLAAALPPMRTKVAQNLALVELSRVLDGCAAFIGHDSGISHLAGALGLPSLILWGDTCEQIWRPPGDNIQIVKAAGGLANLQTEVVLESLQRLCGEHVR